MDCTKLTPPKLAKEWGVAPEKILGWIHTGELPAINAASRLGARPRYLIDRVGIAIFEKRRSATPPPPVSRRRKHLEEGVIEFFPTLA